MARSVTITPGVSLTAANNNVASGQIPTNVILPSGVIYTAQSSAYFEFFPINNSLAQGPGFSPFPVVTYTPVVYVRNIDASAIATLTIQQIGGGSSITLPLGPGGFFLVFNANGSSSGIAVGGITALSNVANSLLEIFYAA